MTLKTATAIIAVLATCASAPLAHAAGADLTHTSKGRVYFHRAGATLAEHDAAVRGCASQARLFDAPPDSTGAGASGGLLGAVLVAVVVGAMSESRNFAANLENCMVVRGWDVVRMPDDRAESDAMLPQPALAAEMAPLVGAAQPNGLVERSFGNEGGKVDTLWFGESGLIGKRSLSLLELAPDTAPKPEAPPKPPPMAPSAKPPVGGPPAPSRPCRRAKP
jgi:hypothetical protein